MSAILESSIAAIRVDPCLSVVDSENANRTFPDQTPPGSKNRPLIINNLRANAPNDRPVLNSQNETGDRDAEAHDNSADDILKQLAAQLATSPQPTDDAQLFLKASMTIASMNFFTVLNRFDTVSLSKRLEEKPELFVTLMNTWARLMEVSIAQQRLELHQKHAESKQREREQKLRARKPILITAATIGSIHTKVRQATGPDKAPSREQDPATPAPQQFANDHAPLTAPGLEPSLTRNTGATETLDVSPGCFQILMTDHGRLITDHPEAYAGNPDPCCAAPSGDLACSTP